MGAELLGVFFQALVDEGIFLPELVLTPRLDTSPAYAETVLRPYYTDAEHFYLHRHIILPSIEKTIVDYLRGIPVGFPESCFKDLNEGDEATTLPLIELMSQSLELLRETTGYFFAAAGDATTANRTFFKLRHQLVENIITRSGFTRETAREDKLIRIGDSRNDDLPITEVVNLYFAETPFMDFLLMPTPFEIPAEARKEHTLVVGGAGAGKTTLLQQLILDDLAQPDPPPMVIVDPKGLLVDRISKLDVFNPDNGRLKDRLVVFDPDDQPSLNMFDAGQSTPETRQPIQNQIIGTSATYSRLEDSNSHRNNKSTSRTSSDCCFRFPTPIFSPCSTSSMTPRRSSTISLLLLRSPDWMKSANAFSRMTFSRSSRNRRRRLKLASI